MDYSEFQIETFLRTGEHQDALRREFGDALYDDLVALAREIGRSRMLERQRRTVFILPGIMGSRLSALQDGVADLVWIHPSDIARGGIAKLKWTGRTGAVAATGTVSAPYMRLRLRLRLAGYDARFLPYDWRQSPAVAGRALMRQITRDGLSDVALVGHSMGGLVARQMAAEDPGGRILSRVVTVGTPNGGSYAPVQIFDLSHGMLGRIAALDLKHDRRMLVRDVLRDFPGLLQMMPAPGLRPEEGYFRADAWPGDAVKPRQPALDAARIAIETLPAPDHRFRQIVGIGERTVLSARIEAGRYLYRLGPDGDGTVPRDLAVMGEVPRFYCRGGHGWLCNRGDVIGAAIDLIGTGETAALPTRAPVLAAEALGAELPGEALWDPTPVRPVAETDLAPGFLSPRTPRLAPRMAAHATGALPAPTGAYPPEIVTAARVRWDGAAIEREEVEESRRMAQPLRAESAARIDAYARRLIRQVEAAEGNGQARALSRDLTRALHHMGAAARQDTTPSGPATAVLERVIGEAEEFLSVMFVKRAVVAAQAVGRIVSRTGGRGFGTGFLIAPGILMTNHHVLPSAEAAREAALQLRYELEIDSREIQGHTFLLEPRRLFHADAGLDMAVVAVAPMADDGAELAEFGYLPLIGVEGKIRKGQPVNIVQHPRAGRKQVVFRESVLTALPEDADHVAHYSGDTQPGSSGSPVFSDRWEVVALHHSGVPATAQNGAILTQDGVPWDEATDPHMRTVAWVANEGIRVSRLVRHLRRLPARLIAAGDPGAALAESILAVSDRAARGDLFLPAPPPRRRTNGAGAGNGTTDPVSPLPARQAAQIRAAEAATTPINGTGGRTLTVPLNLHVEIGSALADRQGSA